MKSASGLVSSSSLWLAKAASAVTPPATHSWLCTQIAYSAPARCGLSARQVSLGARMALLLEGHARQPAGTPTEHAHSLFAHQAKAAPRGELTIVVEWMPGVAGGQPEQAQGRQVVGPLQGAFEHPGAGRSEIADQQRSAWPEPADQALEHSRHARLREDIQEEVCHDAVVGPFGLVRQNVFAAEPDAGSGATQPAPRARQHAWRAVQRCRARSRGQRTLELPAGAGAGVQHAAPRCERPRLTELEPRDLTARVEPAERIVEWCDALVVDAPVVHAELCAGQVHTLSGSGMRHVLGSATSGSPSLIHLSSEEHTSEL